MHTFKEPSRHWLVLVDGTSLAAHRPGTDSYHSNVYNISLYLRTHNKNRQAQVAFYCKGIASAEKSSTKEKLKGIGLRSLVEQAYLNIAMNYNDGDDGSERDYIYLFGFSRGAYILQIICNLIDTYGLLAPSRIMYFDKMYDDWAGIDEMTDRDSFKENYCLPAKISFCGVFDSVLGYYNEDKFSGNTIKVMDKKRKLPICVDHAVHILSIDETRSEFVPYLWNSVTDAKQKLFQIWMPGGHTDIGGGYPERLLSDISLITMLEYVNKLTELQIDKNRFSTTKNEIKARFGRDADKYIHDLGKNWYRPKFIQKKYRRSGYFSGGHYIHCLCKKFNGKYVAVNGQIEQYNLEDVFMKATESSLIASLFNDID